MPDAGILAGLPIPKRGGAIISIIFLMGITSGAGRGLLSPEEFASGAGRDCFMLCFTLKAVAVFTTASPWILYHFPQQSSLVYVIFNTR